MNNHIVLPPALQNYLLQVYTNMRVVSSAHPELVELCQLNMLELDDTLHEAHQRFPRFRLTAEGEMVASTMITLSDLRDHFQHLLVLPEDKARAILSFAPNTSGYFWSDEIGIITDIHLRIACLDTPHGILVTSYSRGYTHATRTYYGKWEEIEALALEAGLKRQELRYIPDWYDFTGRLTGIAREHLDHTREGVLLDLNELQAGARVHVPKEVALEVFKVALGDGFKIGGCIGLPLRASWRCDSYIFEILRHQIVCPVCDGKKELPTEDYDYDPCGYSPVYAACERCNGAGWIKPEVIHAPLSPV